MALVVYDVPKEFKDEELWLKYFNKNSFFVLLATGAIWIAFTRIFESFGIGIIGIVIGGIQCVVITGMTMIPIAETEYMKGAGSSLATYLLRKRYRRKNRVLFVKHFNDWKDSLREKEKEYNQHLEELRKEAVSNKEDGANVRRK